MNDEQLGIAVRQAVNGVHSATPVEQIVRRGRAVRARRRIPAIAGALAAAAGAVVAVIALALSGGPAARPPAGHQQAGHQQAGQLAAWTVIRHPGGSVSVIVREFRDAAGLQRRLRADGVPASVLFYPARFRRGLPFRDLFRIGGNPCRAFARQGSLLKVAGGGRPGSLTEHAVITVLHPAALPRGAGVQFIATRNEGFLNQPGRHALGVWLVQASRQCTGT